MTRLFCLLFVVGLITQEIANTQGLFQNIPKDGAWVTFDTINKLSGPGARDSTVRKVWKTKSVSSQEENGQSCRWIEVVELSADEDVSKATRNKFLIPEKHIAAKHLAPEHVLFHWKQKGEAEIVKTRGPVSSKTFRMFFPGDISVRPFKERKIIKVGDKSLNCRKRIKQEYKVTEDNKVTTIIYNLWLHEDVPFGVAAAVIEMKRYEYGKHRFTWHRKFKLREFGRGAKSDLK